MDTKLITRISYEHIFDDNDTIKGLISKVNVFKSLELLALINKYEYKLREDKNAELRFLLQEWLVDVDEAVKRKILARFIEFSEKKKSRGFPNADFSSVTIINRISTLRLLEIFSSCKPNNKEVDDKSNALLLFKLYLLVSDEVSKRQDKVFKKHFIKQANNLDNIHFYLFFGLTQPILQYSVGKELTPEIFKFLLFEKWLKTQPEYYRMSLNYLNLMGLNNWYEYFTDVFNVNKINIDSHILSIQQYPYLVKVLDYFSLKNDFSPLWTDFMNLKKQPVIKLNSNDYLILDFEFLLNKFFSSLYHDLLNYSQAEFSNKFSQDYNILFIEDVLLHNTFKCVFGNSYVKYSEEDIKKYEVKGIDNLGLPDYYIRNGNKVFLFECKNSFISNSNKIKLDTDALLFEIRDKFYYTTSGKSKTQKDKAVRQLVKYILNSYNYKYSFFDDVKKTNKIQYFPILIVTDHTLCSMGFNKLLNYYFLDEINALEVSLKRKINPLTIIHIDDFLYHRDNLKKLDNIITKYHNYANMKSGFDEMISFSDFIDNKIFKGDSPLKRNNVEHIIENSLLPPE